MKNNEISIICCLYNEIYIIKKKFSEVLKKIALKDFYKEILFIDNNSDDGTKEYLLNFAKNNSNSKLKFIFNKKNLGKGGSIKKAINEAKSSSVVIFDFDEYDFDDIEKGYEIFVNNNYDFLIGSRTLNKAKFIYKKNYYGVVMLTKLMNKLFSTNLTDSASATKFFSIMDKSLINTITSGFNFEFELICNFARKNKKIGEYEINYDPRTVEQGKKIKAFQDGIKILLIILYKKFI